jgi:hypothetical protein
MRILLVIILMAGGFVNAKVVHITIQYTQDPFATAREQYTVDANLKVWQFQNRVFRDYRLDPMKYRLVQEVSGGVESLNPDNALKDYGAQPDDAVLFKVVPAQSSIPQEEAKPADAPAEEAKPADAPAEEAKPADAPAEEAKPADAPAEEAKPADVPAEEGKPEPPKVEIRVEVPEGTDVQVDAGKGAKVEIVKTPVSKPPKE